MPPRFLKRKNQAVEIHLLAKMYGVLPTEILKLTPLELELVRKIADTGARWEESKRSK